MRFAITYGGCAVEQYFHEELEKTASSIEAFKQDGCFAFTLLADDHLNTTREDEIEKHRHTLENIRALHERTDIDAIFYLGDMTYVNSKLHGDYWTQERFDAVQNNLKDSLLSSNPDTYFVAGNHDAPGSVPAEPKQWYEKMVAFHGDRVSGVLNKGYFYVDFPDYQLRAICLMDTRTENGNRFAGYDSEQLCWLCDSALQAPKDYAVLLFAHITLSENEETAALENLQEFVGLMKAYQNKSTYSGAVVHADFTNRESGDVLAMFGGHDHVQWSGYGYGLPFRLVETPCSLIHLPHTEKSWKCPEGFVPVDRERKTLSEDLWDTAVLDIKNKRLHMIRFGAGEDVTYEL